MNQLRGGERPVRAWERWKLRLYAAGEALGGVLLLLTVGFGLATTLPGTGIVDDAGNRIGPDFLTHYTAGRMVLAGEAAHFYDFPVQAAAQEAALGGSLDRTSPFLLPPAAALIFVPFALLPYTAAAALWATVTTVLMAFSLRLVWPMSPLRGQVSGVFAALALVGTYPVGMNLVTGNNAALWLTIYALGARYILSGRAVAAGLVLGLGALKPQLFLGIPVLLLVQRRWRALGVAAGVALVLAAISLAMVGLDGGRQYAEFLTSSAYRSDIAIPNAWRMLSLPAFVAGLYPDVPEWGTVVIMVGGLIALGWAVRRANLRLAYAAAVLVSVVVAPHLFLYDGMILAVPILLLAGGPPWGAPSWAMAMLWALTWLVPFQGAPGAGTIWTVPWAVVPLLVLVVSAMRDALTKRDCTSIAATSGDVSAGQRRAA